MIVDTTRFREMAATCDAGIYALSELDRIYARSPRRREIVNLFSSQCKSAGIEHEILEEEGIPSEVILDAIALNDLVVTAVSTESVMERDGEIASTDFTDVILKNDVPLLILRDNAERPKKVLLVDDDTQASRRAINSFLLSGHFSEYSATLLVVASSAREMEKRSSNARDTIQSQFPDIDIELVFQEGNPCRVIPSYVGKSNHELVVMGIQKQPIWKRLLFSDTLANVIRNTECMIYCAK